MQFDDAYKSFLENNESFLTEMDHVKSEFIFILDRSGSMSGTRIEKAVESLIIFLKSLP